MHALLGTRQKLVVCWVHMSVSVRVISRTGNETLPSFLGGPQSSLWSIALGAGLSVLPNGSPWRWQTLQKRRQTLQWCPLQLGGSEWVFGGGGALACSWNSSARDLPDTGQNSMLTLLGWPSSPKHFPGKLSSQQSCQIHKDRNLPSPNLPLICSSTLHLCGGAVTSEEMISVSPSCGEMQASGIQAVFLMLRTSWECWQRAWIPEGT